MKLKKNDKAYFVLIGALIFGIVVIIVNWAVVSGMPEEKPKDYINSYTTEDDTAWWDIIGHIKNIIGGLLRPVVQFFTLDVYIINILGFPGLMIKAGYFIAIVIGAIDILWLG